MKTGNDNETKEYNKKIIEEMGQVLEERGNTTKSNNSIRRLQWTSGVPPRKLRREQEWKANKQNDTRRRSDSTEYRHQM